MQTWRDTIATIYVCTDWKTHGHLDRYGSQTTQPVPAEPVDAEAAQEAARKQRRTVIANNKAWDSAEAVRRRWLTAYLARKTPEKGTAAFLAGEVVRGSHELRRAMEGSAALLCELLARKKRADLPALAAQATDARAQVLGLAVVLAALEESVTRESWRTPAEAAKRYFTFLAEHGYQLSDVEALVLGRKPAGRKIADGGAPASAGPPDACNPSAPAEEDAA